MSQARDESAGFLLSSAEMRLAERRAIEGGRSESALMESAGSGLADLALRRGLGERYVVLCGPGGNGGDGYVAARRLLERGIEVTVVASDSPISSEAARTAARLCPIEAISMSRAAADSESLFSVRGVAAIDAMFGAGLSRPLSGDAAVLASALGRARVSVVSADMPSGASGDDGRILGDVCVRADVTAAFHCRRPGHLLLPARDVCGDVEDDRHRHVS